MSKMSILGLLCFGLLGSPILVAGHGNMVPPYTWWDVDRVGWFYDEDGHKTQIGCGVLDLPMEGTQYEEAHGPDHPPDCMNNWFSNKVHIPGEQTLPDNMTLPNVTCGHDKNPWFSPGSAPIFGSCGTLGGNPNGCHNDGEGNFGDCCGGEEKGICGQFAMGENAENYPWLDPPVTTWSRYTVYEVSWYVGPNHAGGYSYRLCKVPHDHLDLVSEECFQETPLQFIGDFQWINYKADKETGERTEVKARQTTEGTHPPGSMWRTNPIVHSASDDYKHGHVIDLVMVPGDIEAGEYVLSFRWDCQCTAQVWTSCANILIV